MTIKIWGFDSKVHLAKSSSQWLQLVTMCWMYKDEGLDFIYNVIIQRVRARLRLFGMPCDKNNIHTKVSFTDINGRSLSLNLIMLHQVLGEV